MNEQELREQIAKDIKEALQPATSPENIYMYNLGLKVAADIARGKEF
jgi:hypothetical protein